MQGAFNKFKKIHRLDKKIREPLDSIHGAL